MRYGKLGLSDESGKDERLDILFDDGSVYGGLHCGEAFEIHKNGQWISTRIEFDHSSDDWYLHGVYAAGETPNGLQVRIDY